MMWIPAYVAAARVARRQATRAPWRSLLVIAMVALPITALTAAAIVITTAVPTDAERVAETFGTADIFVYQGGGATTEDVRAAFPPGSRISAESFLPMSHTPIRQGSIVDLQVNEYSTPVDEPPVQGIYHVLDGRAPTSAGEAAVNPHVLDDLGLHLGGVLSLQSGLSLRITGTIVSTEDLNSPVVVVGPGTLTSTGRDRPAAWLIDLPVGVGVGQVVTALSLPGGVAWDTPSTLIQGSNVEPKATGGAFAIATMLLLGTGLVAGAAFAVGARRQLRTLGLLSAAGAERRQVRATVLLGGVTLGAVGSAVGVGLGVAASYAAHPYLDRLTGRYIGPIEIPWAALLGAFALGTLAATLAAFGPARTAAKVPVVQALAERTPPPRRPGRLAVAGVVGVGVGAAAAVQGGSSNNNPVLAVGLVVMSIGILVGIPLLVTWTGRMASFLPTLPRIAARDIARHGRRSGAALAAGAIALALPIAISTVTLGDAARYAQTSHPGADQLMLSGFGSRGIGLSGSGPPVNPARQIAVALKDLRAAFPGSVGAALVPGVTTVTRRGRDREVPISIVTQRDSSGYSSAPVSVGGPDLLRALGAENEIPALERGEVVGIGSGGVQGARVDLYVQGREDRAPLLAGLPATSVGATGSTAVVVLPERAAELGLRPSSRLVVQAVFRTAQPLTPGDIERAKAIVSGQPGIDIVPATIIPSDTAPLRTLTAISGMVIALLIVGVIVALLSAESRRDRAILVAIGAGPRSRRSLAGASAGLIGALSAVFAVVVGLVPTMVLLHVENRNYPFVVPWVVIAVVVFGVPVIAGLSAALVSRQPKAARLLRPIA